MTFDIHQIDRLDSTSGSAEKKFDAYRDELLEQFWASPEGRRHHQQYPENGWADFLMYYGFGYIGCSVPQFKAGDVDELITDIFPRKISLRSPKETEDAIPELIAFWSFLKREYGLRNAAPILEYLESCSPEEFTRSMFSPAKAGVGKSFMMSGEAAGYDMSDERQMKAFMSIYNAEKMAQAQQPKPQDADGGQKEKPTIKIVAPKPARKRHKKH